MAGGCRYVIKNGAGEAQPNAGQPHAPMQIIRAALIEQGSRYKECLRNHAALIGGYATDGCGEFLESGEEGTKEALFCAACACHRNFHRKEVPNHPRPTGLHLLPHPAVTAPPPPPPPTPPLPAPPAVLYYDQQSPVSEDQNDILTETVSREEIEMQMEPKKKVRRTKFTDEQKSRMIRFAAKLGWRPERHEEEDIKQLCLDIGISRGVFKVWLNNNRNRRLGPLCKHRNLIKDSN